MTAVDDDKARRREIRRHAHRLAAEGLSAALNMWELDLYYPDEADRAALCDLIAAAIWERQNPGRRYTDCEYRWRADAEADADVVLTVLRGLTLRELEQLYRPNTPPSRPEPRRLADEAPQPATPGLDDSARIGKTLIWTCADIGKGAFGKGYRAAQAEARALLTGQRGTDEEQNAAGSAEGPQQ